MQKRSAGNARAFDHGGLFVDVGFDLVFDKSRFLRLGGLLHEDAWQGGQIVGHVQTAIPVVADQL